MQVNLCGLFLALLLSSSTASAQLEPLGRMLENGGVEQKRNVLASIRGMRSEEASRIAVPALKDKNVLVRATAAASVIFLPRAEAASLLIPMLQDRDEFVRREAAFALGLVGDLSAVPPLIALLGREKITEVRSAAIIGLGGIGDISAFGPLMNLLAKRPTEDNEFLRRSAARSIGQIAQFIRTGTHDVVTPQNYLPDRYKDLKIPTRAAAADQTKDFSTAAAFLLKVLNNSRESDDTLREAAFALGALGDPSALQALRSKIGAADNYLSEISREAVAKIEAANIR